MEVECGSVVLKESFHKPRRKRGVGYGKILDGEDCRVRRGKEDLGRDLKKCGHDVEPGSSQGFRDVEREFIEHNFAR